MIIAWTSLAEKSFKEHLNYLEENWPLQVAQKFILNTEELLDLIVQDPKTFPIWRRNEKRRIARIDRHISLFYSFDSGRLFLLLFWNNKRNPDKLKRYL